MPDCPHCGDPIDPGDQFCRHCGETIDPGDGRTGGGDDRTPEDRPANRDAADGPHGGSDEYPAAEDEGRPDRRPPHDEQEDTGDGTPADRQRRDQQQPPAERREWTGGERAQGGGEARRGESGTPDADSRTHQHERGAAPESGDWQGAPDRQGRRQNRPAHEQSQPRHQPRDQSRQQESDHPVHDRPGASETGDGPSRRQLLQAGAAVVAIGGVGYAYQDDDITVPFLEDGDGTGDGGDDSTAPSTNSTDATDDESESEDDSGGEEDSNGDDGQVFYDGWLDGVDGFDGTVDYRGYEEVYVSVRGDGEFRFEPAAILVEPGTTVTWEWIHSDAGHTVTHEPDGTGTELFESNLLGHSGETFSHTFEDQGAFKYYCEPHRGLEMKGVVGVGTAEGDVIPPQEAPDEREFDFPTQDIEVVTWLEEFGLAPLLDIAEAELQTSFQLTQRQPDEVYEHLRAAPAEGYTLGTFNVATLGNLGPEGLLQETKPVAQFMTDPSALAVSPGYAGTLEEFLQRAQGESDRSIAVLVPEFAPAALLTARWLDEMFGLDVEIQQFEYPDEAVVLTIEEDRIVATTLSPGVIPSDMLEELDVLAVFAEERLPWLQSVPTARESGIDHPPFAFWRGIFAPGGTPDHHVGVLARAFETATEHPDYAQIAADERWGINFQAPSEFREFVEDQWNLYQEFDVY